MGEIKSAFKVVAVVKTEGLTLYASLFGRTPLIYATGLWHRDGPFFLCRDLESAKEFAQIILPRFKHLAILQAECIPVMPRPRYVPVWYSNAFERLQWRSLVVQDAAVADRFLLQKGVPEHLQDWEILAYEFRLIGEPVVEFLREREVNSDGQRESAASN
jgi:hypothetical protein